jgi:exosortase D (VPLPA-CTERM-specific)
MNPAAPPAHAPRLPAGLPVTLGLAVFVLVCLLLLFRDGVLMMVGEWSADEYNHGYMIPFVALYLLWLRAKELEAMTLRGSWLGVAVVMGSLFLLVLGELSAVYTLTQFGFIGAIWGLALAASGGRGLRLLWVPLVYLMFMVPLPEFLENRLTAQLQLWSSQLGVAVIRLAGLSVYLEGNVIDLSEYKLQVAEACSGMRYLFPLMSFGFLCAVLFRGPVWQRVVLFLATVPITVLMNSFRIGVIGILVNFFGREHAEGFIHDFEGWVVFMACVGVLLTIIWLFARSNGQRFRAAFGLDIPPLADFSGLLSRARPNWPVLTTAVLVAAGLLASLFVTRPPMLAPERQRFATLPMQIGEWAGREVFVDRVYIDALLVTDHIMSNWQRPADQLPVELWVAWYDSQVKGASVHSPQACLPGGGWQIESFSYREVPGVLPDGEALTVNRVVISLGEVRSLVYYWFPQRGRNLTNEFLVKWYIFQDGLTMNRTDGALVRLSTLIPDGTDVAAADRRLGDFLRDASPRLAWYLPGVNAPLRDTADPQDLQSGWLR